MKPEPPIQPRPWSALALGLTLATLSSSCVITESRNVQQPTLQIQSDHGMELGVSTEYGVLFLGRTVRSGEIEVTAWYGDGPSIEPSVVEPLGGGLYTAQTEIELPTTRLTFQPPEPGAWVTVIGRRDGEVWETEAKVLSDPRVDGILLRTPPLLRSEEEQIGAGVFVLDPKGDRVLVGLVSGRLQLPHPDTGQPVSYLTVMGPNDTWRLVVHSRSIQRKKRFVYRDDVL